MAIGVLFDAAGVTQAQYEQVRDEVFVGGKLPQGLLTHIAGPKDGNWCVVEVWESEADLRRFFDERLGSALQRAGITVQPTMFPLVAHLTA